MREALVTPTLKNLLILHNSLCHGSWLCQAPNPKGVSLQLVWGLKQFFGATEFEVHTPLRYPDCTSYDDVASGCAGSTAMPRFYSLGDIFFVLQGPEPIIAH